MKTTIPMTTIPQITLILQSVSAPPIHELTGGRLGTVHLSCSVPHLQPDTTTAKPEVCEPVLLKFLDRLLHVGGVARGAAVAGLFHGR